MLLLLGQWGSLVSGGFFGMFLILAPLNVGTYSISNEVVTGPEFFRRAGLMFAVTAGLLLTIGLGLWREREWVRPLMIFFWLATPLGVLATGDWTSGDLVAACVSGAVAASVAGWYLYNRMNVTAYFDARRSSSDEHDA